MSKSLYLVAKVSKRAKKCLKKATNWTYIWFFEKKIVLANLILINSYNMRKKCVMSLYKFWTYFFPFTEVEASFSNLFSTAINNFIKPKVDFFCK